MNNPYLLFEFKDSDGIQKSKVFTKPEQVIKAVTLEGVEEAFQRVEKFLARGFYAAGYVSYEAAPAFDSAFTVSSKAEWPLVWFGIFKSPESFQDPGQLGTYEVSGWHADGDYQEYADGIKKIKQAIEQGNTYQVNYTTRLQSTFHGDDFAFYRQLADNQKSSYSAYLNMGEFRLLSASPELFFRIDGDTITTKPMKGTAKRGRWTAEDEGQKKRLYSSDKERSENLMIVDLLRNDLGRVAVPGSVKVPRLFEIETYPTVHQMTSTITGKLPSNTSMMEVFQALFPCGSITGAPKVRTMEYIEKLEQSPREVYCGAIGYMTPDREAVFNVPIRTVMINHDSGKAIYGTGGGVTWDSTSKGEYEEIHTKARLLTEKRPNFELLETMKLINGNIPLLERHLSRVALSARYFEYPLDIQKLRTKLLKIAAEYERGLYKIRMLIEPSGMPSFEMTAITQTLEEVTCSLAIKPIDESNPFFYHKTTNREMYREHNDPQAFAVLLWNSKGQLTEFTMANLVVKEGEGYYTPPVESGLLAGTFREKLIEEGRIQEKVLYKKDLDHFNEIWMVNGVRGWVRVKMARHL
ncbi:aminodeoxychorismate synthase component I [Halobacillus mangrovi]|uniref:Aminodeoxychorismate synthase, component I n=1 Tax=Halobacillus mangrovi TaxID=402384 RepID=A0A1W5ZRG6_9BACI|nr:aminodeoxychorismate synthase component I [Halobacillus mangrovi]ARI75879.1 aminodeoxychorismate synthase, component I [Halobacillus mangrovi]